MDTEPRRIELLLTTRAHRQTVSNLYQLYIYEYTAFMPWDVDTHGCYEESDLEECWTEGRDTYLITVNDRIAGLAFIDNGPDLIEMAEFFILRRYQGQGVGAEAARLLFDRYRGRWRVAELTENTRAHAFWRKVIGQYTGGQFEDRQERRGPAQYFDNQIPRP